MDTKKVRALITAVNSGSLSSAAESLGYTQSGLTHMMNSLEDELNLTLLVRNRSGVRLSPSGLALLEEMQNLLTAVDALEHAADAVRERSITTFRVGAYSSVARHWLPSIIADFKLFNPETDMVLSMQDIRETYDAVKNEELDCAIVSYQEDYMSGLCWTPLRDDELIAVLPGAYDLAEGPFPVEYFAGMDFLMPSGGFNLDIMPVFSDVSPKQLPVFRYTNMDDAAIVSMVGHGLGVSILSRLVMQGISDNIAQVSLQPSAFRRLGIIVKERRCNEKNLKNFISTAKDTLERME